MTTYILPKILTLFSSEQYCEGCVYIVLLLCKHNLVGMKHTLSQLNPPEFDDIDGFWNYNLEVSEAEGPSLHNKSVLNLYFLDNIDYSTVTTIYGYG